MKRSKAKQVFPGRKSKGKKNTTSSSRARACSKVPKKKIVPIEAIKKKKTIPAEQRNSNEISEAERIRRKNFRAMGVKHRWKPGQSGNPKGKSKGLDMTNSLRKILTMSAQTIPFIQEKADELEIDTTDKAVTVIDVLMTYTLIHSLNGKSDIFKQVWERMEGSIKQSIGLNEDDPVFKYMEEMDEATMPKRPKDYKKKKPKPSNGKTKKVKVIKKVSGNGKR